MRSRSPSRVQKGTEDIKVVKAAIPKALREQVWLAGRVYERRCLVPW
jgi:hypothetical protein